MCVCLPWGRATVRLRIMLWVGGMSILPPIDHCNTKSQYDARHTDLPTGTSGSVLYWTRSVLFDQNLFTLLYSESQQNDFVVYRKSSEFSFLSSIEKRILFHYQRSSAKEWTNNTRNESVESVPVSYLTPRSCGRHGCAIPAVRDAAGEMTSRQKD